MRRAFVALGLLSITIPGLAADPAAGEGKEPNKDAKPKAQPATFAAEVLVLHATNAKKGIDARIGSMPELKKPPFSSYDSYQLIDRARLPLEKDVKKTLKLPNGRVLETHLLEVLSNDSVRMSTSINQPGGKEFLPWLETKAKLGQAFMLAGQRYKQGILVLVIRVVR